MVWSDQELCTRDGYCDEIEPDGFMGSHEVLWVVQEEASTFGATIIFDAAEGDGHGPDGSRGVARVPDSQIDVVVEAAEECPGECIMIEPFDAEVMAARGV